jgi:MFS transporter, UMF1 family
VTDARQEAAPPARRVSRAAVAAWAAYDLGNTVFSFNILSLYLPLWVVNDMGGQDSDYGLANSLSMALVLVSAPLIGALSDQARRRVPYLIGQGGLAATLALFVVANLAYQAGLIFYDALLPAVSTEENRGRIGGLGVGIGYLGSFLGVGVGLLVLARDPAAKPLVFQLTALLFLLFALPCFFLVREPPRADAKPFGLASVRAAVGELGQTATRARRYPGLARFLVGRVFYADAANTMIAFMGIYVTNEVGFEEGQTQLLLLSGIAAGVVGGLAWGVVVDRLGPKLTLFCVLGLWIGVFGLAASIGGLGLPGWLFWIAAPLSGLALGGPGAADRPLMLQLAPPRYLGQFYGLYAMVGRFGSIVGPLMWSWIVDGLGLGRPVAVAWLAVMVVVSMIILAPVPRRPRPWRPDELVPTAS